MHIWVRPAGAERNWAIANVPEDGRALVLTGQAERPVEVLPAGQAGRRGMAYVARRPLADGGGECMLFVPADVDVRVNGHSVRAAGLKALQDKDSLAVGQAERLWFSTAQTPRIEPFPGLDGRQAICPRCQQVVAPQSPSVRCPSCKVWYHQDVDADLKCWTYAETCGLCPQLTSLDGAYPWSPEGL